MTFPEGRAKNANGTVYYSVPGVAFRGTILTIMGLERNYQPFRVVSEITVTQMALNVTTAEAGKSVRLGIYRADEDLQPTSLVVDAGTVSVGTTGKKSLAVEEVLSPGRYLISFQTDSATAAFRGWVASTESLLTSLSANLGAVRFRVATPYEPLPDPGVKWDEFIFATDGFRYPVVLRVGEGRTAGVGD